MVANMLNDSELSGSIEVRLGVDYLASADAKEELDSQAEKVVYTGAIDAYFDYKLGNLEYRSVRFETETLDTPNFQGNAAVNYTDAKTPGQELLNTNGLSSVRMRMATTFLRLLSAVNTALSGSRVMSHIIL